MEENTNADHCHHCPQYTRRAGRGSKFRCHWLISVRYIFKCSVRRFKLPRYWGRGSSFSAKNRERYFTRVELKVESHPPFARSFELVCFEDKVIEVWCWPVETSANNYRALWPHWNKTPNNFASNSTDESLTRVLYSCTYIIAHHSPHQSSVYT